jgi:hypothetical protein
MGNKPSDDKTESKQLKIMLHKELLERIKSFCAERSMTIQEFVTDAIIDKLKLAYKERRKRPRL